MASSRQFISHVKRKKLGTGGLGSKYSHQVPWLTGNNLGVTTFLVRVPDACWAWRTTHLHSKQQTGDRKGKGLPFPFTMTPLKDNTEFLNTFNG